MILACFQDVGCYQFCERVKQVQSHSDLTRLLILSLQNHQVNLARVNFELSSESIAKATRILDSGERWFKQKKLDLNYYEPYLKPSCQQGYKAVFPFSHLLERCTLLMRQIIRYFTCEGRYSRVYSYHIRLLMHFTRVKLPNLPYYLYRSIDKMASVVKKRSYAHQMQSLFHKSLVKMIVLHQLE